MKKLSDLYPNQEDIEIKGIKINSNDIEKGDLFLCITGVTADRHDFIDQAVQNGASAIVVSRDGISSTVPIINVENTNVEFPKLCAKFYDHPEEKLKLIGITGTDGKTTTAQFIQYLIGDDRCAYMGTNGRICKKFTKDMRNTTPDADRLYCYLDEFVQAGCSYVSMEASSEAFFRNRLQNICFDVSVLTNVTEDHLNTHKTIENYIQCKSQLFLQTKKSGVSILNIDDLHYSDILKSCLSTVYTYGKKEGATLRILKIEKETDGTTSFIFSYQNQQYCVHSPFFGDFNVYNLCAALLCAVSFGVSLETMIKRISTLPPIPGRCEFLNFGQDYRIVLDYAHTENALRHILSYLKSICKGKLIVVEGSAGGREHEKRGRMGKVILDTADEVIFTMDDPRFEDVNDIIDELVLLSDRNDYVRIIDRKEAIYKALSIASKEDIVLVVGKGRDNYMAIRDEYIPYSDYDTIQSYYEKKNE